MKNLTVVKTRWENDDYHDDDYGRQIVDSVCKGEVNPRKSKQLSDSYVLLLTFKINGYFVFILIIIFMMIITNCKQLESLFSWFKIYIMII